MPSKRRPSKRTDVGTRRSSGKAEQAREARDLEGLFEDALVSMVGVATRVRLGTEVVEAEVPALAHSLGAARTATSAFIEGLTAVLAGDRESPAAFVEAVNEVADHIARYGETLYSLKDLPVDRTAVIALPLALTTSIPGPFLFQMASPPPSGIPLELLIRLVDELILYIDRLLRSWSTNPRAAAGIASAQTFFEALRAYRASLVGRLAQGAGQRVPIRQVIRVVGRILLGLMRSAANFLSRAQLQALGARFAAWFRNLGPIIGAGGGEAGAASVAVLWGILLAILVAYLSVWLGRIIGNTRVGDKTIDEHLFGFFDILYESYKMPCQVPLGQFIQNAAARRSVEALDPPPKTLLKFYLEAEIEDLDKLIEQDCDGRAGFWKRLRDERARRLAELGN